MIRAAIIAAVLLALGGCDAITAEDWIGQHQVAAQVAHCHANPSFDPQLCAQIAPETKS